MKTGIVSLTVVVLALSPARAGMRGTQCRRLVAAPETAGDCVQAQFEAQLRAIGIEPAGISQFGAPPAPVAARAVVREVKTTDGPRCGELLSQDQDSCDRVKCQLDRLDQIKKSHEDARAAMAEVFGARFLTKTAYESAEDRCIAQNILALPGVGDYELASGIIDSSGHLPVFKAAELEIKGSDPVTGFENNAYRKSDPDRPVLLSCKLDLLIERLLAEKMGYSVVPSWPLTLGTLNCQVPAKGMFNY